MKKFLLLLMLSFAIFQHAEAQHGMPVNANTGKVTFMEVVDAKNMKAEDLYKFLNEWCVSKGLTSTKKDDAAFEAVYSGNYVLEYPGVKNSRTDKGKVNYTVSVYGKDGKYRYIITDFVHEGLEGAGSGGKFENIQPDCGKDKMVPGNWVLIKNKTKVHVDNLVLEMKKAELAFQNDPAKNKDW